MSSSPVLSMELARAVAAARRARVRKAREADPWRAAARLNQVTPEGDWTVWLRMAGRGEGKTRSGAEFIREEVMAGRMKRVALVARTAADTRDVMVEGESGLLACCERYLFKADYQSSKRRVIFGNGAKAYLYSAQEPALLRGPQHDGAWADEVGAWTKPDAWDQLQFGLRLHGPQGNQPRMIATTTPRPTKTILKILKRAGLALSTGTTYDNRANLAESFFEEIISQYEGTRLGRQELMGELLNALEGALWSYDQIDALRVDDPPAMARVVVAVDPPASDGPSSAECGIVVVGLGIDRHGYVLADYSLKGSPNEWGNMAYLAAREWDADTLVIETNQGGEMAIQTLRTVGQQRGATRRIVGVHASKGKLIRAEPVAALYEQRRVFHVTGDHPKQNLSKLEDQMCSFLPEEQARQRKDDTGEGQASPDRLDACLIAGTLVTTSRGDEPIERVKIGDLVLTRDGWKPVTNAGMTSAASPIHRVEFSNGASLTGTGNHPVWVAGKGFVRLDTLVCGDIIEACNHHMMKPSSFMASGTHDDRNRRTNTSADTIGHRARVGRGRSIARYGCRYMGPSRMGATSTITTETRSTTTSRILCVSQKKSMLSGMRRSMPSSEGGTRRIFAPWRQPGTTLRRESHGIVSTERCRGKGESPSIESCARIVGKRSIRFLRNAARRAIAAGDVTAQLPMWSIATRSKLRARSAEACSGRTSIEQSLPHAPVSVVRRLESGVAPVYNLSVAESPEYFANGILVHNCVWGVTNLLVKSAGRTGASV